MRLKKVFLGMGIAALSVPATLVFSSCSSSNNLSKFKLDGKTYNVKDTGIYLVNDQYKNGTLWTGNNKTGKAFNGHIEELGKYDYVNNVVEMAPGDSLYLLFKDNDPKYSINDVQKELYLNDTSVSNELLSFDGSISNNRIATSDAFNELLVGFDGNANHGKLEDWLGSQQNNHPKDLTFDKAMMNIKNNPKVSVEAFTHLAKYYGVKPDPVDGHFVEDPAIKNPATHTFLPVFPGEGYFTYDKVNSNAIKITFESPSGMTTLSSTLALVPKDLANKPITTDDVKTYGTLVLGTKTQWDTYENSTKQDYNYIGRKNVYIKQER